MVQSAQSVKNQGESRQGFLAQSTDNSLHRHSHYPRVVPEMGKGCPLTSSWEIHCPKAQATS